MPPIAAKITFALQAATDGGRTPLFPRLVAKASTTQ